MGVADLLNSLEPEQGDGDGDLNLWIELPSGYLPLPVENSVERLAEVEPVLAELCPPERRELLYATLNTFATLLTELGQRNTAYCGLGWHTAEDGTAISSTLVVSLQPTEEERNPRLLLGDLVQAAANAGDQGQAELVDLPSGPALFFESVRNLRKPMLPGQEGDPGRADVYQLEAIVPSERGNLLAVMEFSTPQVEYGTLYRDMMVELAQSVSFTPPARPDGGNSSAQQIHDLLGGPSA
jgi:hypothetical protein